MPKFLKLLDVNRQTVSMVFDRVTDRIAYVLGGEFSDASFLDRVQSLNGNLNAKNVYDIFEKKGIIKMSEQRCIHRHTNKGTP